MAKDALLIDGLCSLCTRTGKFISRRQVKQLEITEQESDLGVELLNRYNLKIDSLVLIRNKKAYVRSSAAIRCLLYMRWNWRCLYPLAWIIPLPIRDLVYVLVAKSRHRI
jgi:predicted DCC family thiol-disulfide oxidoreductase YuxK